MFGTHVNLAENASALPVPLVAARLLDVKRRKLTHEISMFQLRILEQTLTIR